MLLADLVATSDAVASTRSRTAKVNALAALLKALAHDEVEIAIGLLTGEPRQGRVGVGWATIWHRDTAPAATPSLTLHDLDTAISTIETTTGSGSQTARGAHLDDLFALATERETHFMRRLFGGELRQGALAGLMTDAVARAAAVPLDAVRRAAMLGGDLGRTAQLALVGGEAALLGVKLEVLHAVQPMLAASAPDVGAALDLTGLASVEWKLDGVRVQVHRSGDEVCIFTRNLNDVTARMPDVVAMVRALPGGTLVLDGEVIGIVEGERPQRFQDTMSSFGRERHERRDLGAFFFDALHVDGSDLLDAPLHERRAAMESIDGLATIPRLVTADAAQANAFLDAALAQGHEGVMVKALDAAYDAGRRGGAWRKVKPVRTLDLVVLAAEWGHGRRQGWLSNLHLGARGPDGSFVMVGKTFKGLTDALLTWQTEQLQALAIATEPLGARAPASGGGVVHVRPELVVEIALDGVQRSTRYPGGVALRFARVRRYRTDKSAADADTIETVQAMLSR